MRSTQSGYTLASLAIVMAIFGAMLSGGLLWRSAQLHLQQESLTRMRIERIEDHLYHFIRRHHFVPCPESSDHAVVTYDPISGNCLGVKNNTGYIPLRLLGLMPEDALDGLGKPFRYHVARFATEEGRVLRSDFRSDISVSDLMGHSKSDYVLGKQSTVLFVILSDGARVDHVNALADTKRAYVQDVPHSDYDDVVAVGLQEILLQDPAMLASLTIPKATTCTSAKRILSSGKVMQDNAGHIIIPPEHVFANYPGLPSAAEEVMILYRMAETIADICDRPIATSNPSCPGDMVWKENGGCQCLDSQSSWRVSMEMPVYNGCALKSQALRLGVCSNDGMPPIYTNAPLQTSMVLWLDGKDCTTVHIDADTNQVSLWQDKSGHGYHTQHVGIHASHYVWNTEIDGGYMALDQSALMHDVLPVTGKLGGTLFLVMRTVDKDPLASIVSFQNELGESYYRVSLAPSVDMVVPQASSVRYPEMDMSGSQFTMMTIRNPSQGSLEALDLWQQQSRYHGAIEKENGSAMIDMGETGRFFLGSSRFKGDIAELILYDAPLSDAQIASVQAYLMMKWKLRGVSS